jgi:hypothetical protein
MKFLIFALLIYTPTAFSKLFLNIHIHNMKGIDKDLTLASELHSREEVHDSKTYISLGMRNGVKVRFLAEAEIEGENGQVGPSDKILIKTEILTNNGQVLRAMDEQAHRVRVGDTQSLVISKDDQTIEVTISPEIR